MLLDGLRSIGRLNNFINTPIKKKEKLKLEDDGEEKMGEIGPRLVIEMKEGTEKAIIEYSSANFPTSLLFFSSISFFLLRFTLHSI